MNRKTLPIVGLVADRPDLLVLGQVSIVGTSPPFTIAAMSHGKRKPH